MEKKNISELVEKREVHWPQEELAWREAQGCAVGKAIIVGEHSVVYGSNAVAMPLKSLNLSLQLNKSDDPASSIVFEGRKVPDHVLKVLDDCFKLFGKKPCSLSVTGSSKVLIGSGMGSSAALCIALIRAFAKLYRMTLSPEEQSQMGRRLEKLFHGNPSGLDTAVVAYENVICFSHKNGPQNLVVAKPNGFQCMDWPFVLIDSSVRAATLDMVKKAEPYFTCKSEGQKRLLSFDKLALQTRDGLQNGDFIQVETAMAEVSVYLEESGIVSSSLKEIISFAFQSGIKSAKITGAGGGGCVLALLNPDKIDHQLKLLRNRFGYDKVFSVFLPADH